MDGLEMAIFLFNMVDGLRSYWLAPLDGVKLATCCGTGPLDGH
jgi:hypothetical protein